MAFLPEIKVQNGGDAEAQLRQLRAYVRQLEEQIRYVLNNLGAENLSDKAITADKLAPDSITPEKIEDGAVTTEKIKLYAIGVDQLDAGSVTADKIDALAVQTRHLAAGAVTTNKLDAYAVTADKLAAGAVTADHIAANAVTADALAANAVTAAKLAADVFTAIYADMAQAQIDWADINTLVSTIANIADAHISTADIDWAHIKDLISGTAIITQGEAGELYIARLSVTEANLVRLSVGELLVRGEDGGFWAITVDDQGNVTTEQKMVANDDVEDLSIHGSQKLIEGSITADTLNAENIFADNAVIRQLIAANLDVDTLFARQAVLDALNTADISSNDSIRLYIQSSEELNAFVRVTEDGLEIGRAGDPMRFVATNRTLEVPVVKTEQMTIAQSMSGDAEWSWIATNSGLGLRYIGP